jgi:hypothetical protein
VRRLAELTPELATEVRTREPRGSGEIVDRVGFANSGGFVFVDKSAD